MAATRKATCKITNGSKCNESLVQRGSITFWFSDGAIDHWHHPNDPPRAGHPCIYGDGAYDKSKVYEPLGRRGMQAVIPPQRNAKIHQPGNTNGRLRCRDAAIEAIRRRGRRQWKTSVGYHRRSLSERAMYRTNCCFGERLKNRLLPNQRTEARLRSKILNRFTHLGLPQFEWRQSTRPHRL